MFDSKGCKIAARQVLVAVFLAFLFLRSTAGAFWTVENRFFLHWRQGDALGVSGAILMVGMLFFLAWTLSGRMGRYGRWVREAAFVMVLLQYARVNVAESLESMGVLLPWVRRGLQGIHLLILFLFLVRRRPTVSFLRNGSLVASPILAVYALTLLAAPQYGQIMNNRIARQTLDRWAMHENDIRPFPGNPKRILVIVFDEWSYARTFVDGAVSEDFPELRRVVASGLVFTEAYSPATETLKVLPGLLRGSKGTSRIARDGALWFESDSQESQPYTQQSTMFSDFKARGYRNAMIGNYLPYSSLIGHEADVCISFDLYRVLGTSPSALCASLIIDNARMRLGFIHPSIGWPANLAKHRYFDRMAAEIHAMTLSLLSVPGPLFVMVHHSVPHMPFIFDRTGAREGLHHGATLKVEDYRGNLRFTDRLIGEIFDAVRSQPDGGPLLILTGDHGFREDTMWEGLKEEEAEMQKRHVPLIIVPPGGTEAKVIDARFELTGLRALLTQWADTGEIE